MLVIGSPTRAKMIPIPAADANEVMLQALEYLVEHAQGGHCGCEICARYWRVRMELLGMFGEPE